MKSPPASDHNKASLPYRQQAKEMLACIRELGQFYFLATEAGLFLVDQVWCLYVLITCFIFKCLDCICGIVDYRKSHIRNA